MKNKQIAGITFTDNGILIEKKYDYSPQPSLKIDDEEKFTGEFLEIAKRLAKYRMAHCYKQLHQNITTAEHITPQMIFWKNGHFSVPVWEGLENILTLKDVRDLNLFQTQQLIRSMLFHRSSWLYDHDENWNESKGKDILCTEEFKLFLTEHMLCCDVRSM